MEGFILLKFTRSTSYKIYIGTRFTLTHVGLRRRHSVSYTRVTSNNNTITIFYVFDSINNDTNNNNND